MLTQDQLIQLEPLTQHPKYGQLLKDAIEVWKREDVIPKINNYGIITDNENVYFIENNSCCLIGASLTGKKSLNIQSKDASRIFNISFDEIWEIIKGFDNEKVGSSDAWTFGNEVGKIVLTT